MNFLIKEWPQVEREMVYVTNEEQIFLCGYFCTHYCCEEEGIFYMLEGGLLEFFNCENRAVNVVMKILLVYYQEVKIKVTL
jgi:hypothetical protein